MNSTFSSYSVLMIGPIADYFHSTFNLLSFTSALPAVSAGRKGERLGERERDKYKCVNRKADM